MSKKYSSQEIVSKIQQYLVKNDDKLNKFYDSKFFASGVLSDTNEKVIDFIAKYIIDSLIEYRNGEWILKSIDKDPKATAKESDESMKYCSIVRENKEGEGEEQFQRDLYFKRKTIPIQLQEELEGEEFIYFELAASKGRGAGKGIDLLSYNCKNRLSIYELKYGKVNENILKAILEIQTYYQRTNFVKFQKDWEYNRKNRLVPFSFDKLQFNEVRKVIIIDKRTNAYSQREYPNIRRLIELFQIKEIYF